jgi:hypothetical protein
MARIRTVKPEFFQHEALQDLESQHADLHPMLVFAGLWGHCDKRGVFEWKPRTLKLHILPFLTFDMEEALGLLETAGQIESFEAAGRKYGHIPSFEDHQRIGGKEHSDPAKHPAAPSKQRESTGEAPGKHSGLQEGKGRDREGRGTGKEGKGTAAAAVDNSARSGEEQRVGEDFSDEDALPEDPQSPKNGHSKAPRAVERRNGSFEEINDTVEKLVKDWHIPVGEVGRLAQMAHVSEDQVKVALGQLRDRGRIPLVAA